MHNFILEDLSGSLRAVAAFAAILFCPGYLLGVATNLFGFRRQSALERIAVAVSLSFACTGILVSLAGHIVSIAGIAAAAVAGVLATIVILYRDRTAQRIRKTVDLAWIAGFLGFGAVLVLTELIDIQRGHSLFLSVTTLDQAYRVAFINAIARAGIPPSNPLYYPGQPAPLRYYYFWYALCAVCMKVAHVTARQALIAGSVWCELGLTAAIALYAKYFLNVQTGLQRCILRGLLLLAVTGLDILPVSYNLFASHDFRGDLEWWSTDQVPSWLDSILWVPNHLAALLCCLTAFLLLWRSRDRGSRTATILAGVSAASAFGLSIYVAVGFAILMLAWTLRLSFLTKDAKPIRRGLVVAGIASALLLPFLREMLTAGSGTQAGSAAAPTHLFQFSVRKMIDSSLITDMPAFDSLRASHAWLLDQAVRLFLLVPGYALELGVLALVLLLVFRQRKQLDEARRTLLFLSWTGLVLAGFMRSTVIGNNDFGYRAVMLPCFFLLLLAMDRMSGFQLAPRREKLLLFAFILLGVAGTAFQAVMLRIFVPRSGFLHAAGLEGEPEAAFRERAGYRSVEGTIPAGALVQSSMSRTNEYSYVPRMLFEEEPMATDGADDCGAVFGGKPAECERIRMIAHALFQTPAPSGVSAVAACGQLGVTYLAVSSSDPAWRDREGWVWHLQPVTAPGRDAEEFRVVKCGLDAKTMP